MNHSPLLAGSGAKISGIPSSSRTSRWPTNDSSPGRYPVAAITTSGWTRFPSTSDTAVGADGRHGLHHLDLVAPDRLDHIHVDD